MLWNIHVRGTLYPIPRVSSAVACHLALFALSSPPFYIFLDGGGKLSPPIDLME